MVRSRRGFFPPTSCAGSPDYFGTGALQIRSPVGDPAECGAVVRVNGDFSGFSYYGEISLVIRRRQNALSRGAKPSGLQGISSCPRSAGGQKLGRSCSETAVP